MTNPLTNAMEARIDATEARISVRDKILAERDKGRIVYQAMPGEFMTVALDDFLKQPADGILYDLNRLEEISLTFLKDPKWINDFAVALVIRKLIEQRDEARTAAREAAAAENKECDACVASELAKLGGRWSLDSAYLSQALEAIRARVLK